MQDRNFDDIAEKFSRNIYGTTKGQLRQAILWQDLEPLLAQTGPGPLRVLDAGGGEGQTAIRVAELGHHVTLCDLSAEMVARAQQAARDKGVIDNMHFVQCAAQDIAQHLESPVDLILFHAVLEWVAEPQEMLRTLWSVLRVYGWLEALGWQITGKTGVRVFHDYLREKRKQHDSFTALLELETRYCRQEPYISLGRYIHVTALKKDPGAQPQMQG